MVNRVVRCPDLALRSAPISATTWRQGDVSPHARRKRLLYHSITYTKQSHLPFVRYGRFPQRCLPRCCHRVSRGTSQPDAIILHFPNGHLKPHSRCDSQRLSMPRRLFRFPMSCKDRYIAAVSLSRHLTRLSCPADHLSVSVRCHTQRISSTLPPSNSRSSQCSCA